MDAQRITFYHFLVKKIGSIRLIEIRHEYRDYLHSLSFTEFLELYFDECSKDRKRERKMFKDIMKIKGKNPLKEVYSVKDFDDLSSSFYESPTPCWDDKFFVMINNHFEWSENRIKRAIKLYSNIINYLRKLGNGLF